MNKIVTNDVLMIRPHRFGINVEAAVDKTERVYVDVPARAVASTALRQFDFLANHLEHKGICVYMIQDDERLDTPGAVFAPHTFCTNGRPELYFFPMRDHSRRMELIKFRTRISDLCQALSGDTPLTIHDLSDSDEPLEGLGSIVHDPYTKIAFCARSSRSDERLFRRYCDSRGYEPVMFSTDDTGRPIPHTNRMLSICEHLAFVCLDLLPDAVERKRLTEALAAGNKVVIDMDPGQMKAFGTCCIELGKQRGKSLLVFSKRGFQSLTDNQKMLIYKYNDILYADIGMFEQYAGNGINSMIAPMYLMHGTGSGL
ncbi:MAG: arginine deiminase-related protein [Eubacteriales bacterium]|nr:arginine deiminase-related protein [Eubacteriales bacterium]